MNASLDGDLWVGARYGVPRAGGFDAEAGGELEAGISSR